MLPCGLVWTVTDDADLGIVNLAEGEDGKARESVCVCGGKELTMRGVADCRDGGISNLWDNVPTGLLASEQGDDQYQIQDFLLPCLPMILPLSVSKVSFH
uniref:Uncharacterized protein n=1 Tax=Trypanosoma congolense (strain IL3000) TaxID=1068625 RepID=G0UU88_TRYCI|nr:hypothetical protein, unlikely [Trypanosoma congolense IL3000]